MGRKGVPQQRDLGPPEDVLILHGDLFCFHVKLDSAGQDGDAALGRYNVHSILKLIFRDCFYGIFIFVLSTVLRLHFLSWRCNVSSPRSSLTKSPQWVKVWDFPLDLFRCHDTKQCFLDLGVVKSFFLFCFYFLFSLFRRMEHSCTSNVKIVSKSRALNAPIRPRFIPECRSLGVLCRVCNEIGAISSTASRNKMSTHARGSIQYTQ